MTLNASGPISLAGGVTGQSIAIELSVSSTGQISLNDTNVRNLAGVLSGQIVMPTNFWGKSSNIPFGSASYTAAGTYTFVVPDGCTTICCVCVGAGYGSADGGGGGALSYSNDIPVTPGESLTVTVGAAAQGFYNSGNRSGSTSLARGATTLVLAQGANSLGGQASAGIGAVRYNGGNGYIGSQSMAGGGASGYAGNGGDAGRKFPFLAPTEGSGGGGGGGYATGSNAYGGGGGVGLIVQGANGAAGTSTLVIGQGGSSGTNANGRTGGVSGGGGGGHGDSIAHSVGGVGGCRIIYGGSNKNYPNNSAP